MNFLGVLCVLSGNFSNDEEQPGHEKASSRHAAGGYVGMVRCEILFIEQLYLVWGWKSGGEREILMECSFIERDGLFGGVGRGMIEEGM